MARTGPTSCRVANACSRGSGSGVGDTSQERHHIGGTQVCRRAVVVLRFGGRETGRAIRLPHLNRRHRSPQLGEPAGSDRSARGPDEPDRLQERKSCSRAFTLVAAALAIHRRHGGAGGRRSRDRSWHVPDAARRRRPTSSGCRPRTTRWPGSRPTSVGVAHGRRSADWVARPEAQTVVIHFIPPGGTTAGGPRIACADLE
jgi:hypothetical protein